MTTAFSTFQETFAAALLDPDRPAPDAVTSHTARAPQKRFAVYRNNVIAGLIAALRAQFPATEKIVGGEFFAAMARVYIATHPPRSPILVVYGEGFPRFIEGFSPAADVPYLPDVARLEVARTSAYHAADAAPLDPGYWQALDPETLMELRVSLHPSVQILRSSFPVVTIWAMNSGEATLGSVENGTAEDALVLRPQLDVRVRRLPAGGAAFLAAIAGGATLGQSAEAGTADHPDFDLAASLAELIGAGLAVAPNCLQRYFAS